MPVRQRSKRGAGCQHPTGSVPAAIRRVLAEAGQPMRAEDIRQAAEQWLDAPLSTGASSNALRRLIDNPNSGVERIGRGVYRLRGA